MQNYRALAQTSVAVAGTNKAKNRYSNVLPCILKLSLLHWFVVVYCIFMYLLKQPAFKFRLYIWFHWWVRFFAYGVFWKSAFNLVNRTCQTNRLSRLKSLTIFSGILNWNPKMITQGWYLKQRSMNQDHQTTSMQAMYRYCFVILSMVYLKSVVVLGNISLIFQSNSSGAQNVVYSWLIYAHVFEHRFCISCLEISSIGWGQ